MVAPLKLKPVFKERVWGGNRLLPESDEPIGEAWIVYEGCIVEGGEWDGLSLQDVARRSGAELLGTPVMARTGHRFPLLIKLLHSTEWLSVQVHPDDEQARALEGPDAFGKTEAWHVLNAGEGAKVVYGLSDGLDKDDIRSRIDAGTLEEVLNFQPVSSGDTLFTPAGCVHAIGPGLLIYEVQQTSDITYRLYDWNRPPSAGRELHVEQGLEVVGRCSGGNADLQTELADSTSVLTGCEYFVLDQVAGKEGQLTLDTGQRSFHCLTVTSGSATVEVGGAVVTLATLETVVVPAAAGSYQINALEPFEALLSRVP